MKIEIKSFGDQAAMVFDEETIQRFGFKLGDVVTLEFDDAGATMTPADGDYQIRFERGLGFIRKYIKTFEALAK